MKELLFRRASGQIRVMRWVAPLLVSLIARGHLALAFECDGRVVPDAWINDDYW
jgi:hypothetical protein